MGMPSGDMVFDSYAVWAQGLYGGAILNGANGFHSNSTGIAVGAEGTIGSDIEAGVAYAYTNTSVRPLNKKTDVDSHTPFLYAQYKPSAWYVNAVASYTFGKYEDKSYVAGSQINADHDVNSLSFQVMTGYDLDVAETKFTPEAGLRYSNIREKSYTDSVGSAIDSRTSDVLTGVLGVTISDIFALGGLDAGEYLTPALRIAATYDFERANGDASIIMANGALVDIKGSPLERFGGEVGLSLTKDINEHWGITIEYVGQFRKYYQDHTGLLNFKYRF